MMEQKQTKYQKVLYHQKHFVHVIFEITCWIISILFAKFSWINNGVLYAFDIFGDIGFWLCFLGYIYISDFFDYNFIIDSDQKKISKYNDNYNCNKCFCDF